MALIGPPPTPRAPTVESADRGYSGHRRQRPPPLTAPTDDHAQAGHTGRFAFRRSLGRRLRMLVARRPETPTSGPRSRVSGALVRSGSTPNGALLAGGLALPEDMLVMKFGMERRGRLRAGRLRGPGALCAARQGPRAAPGRHRASSGRGMRAGLRHGG
jgi:hypothetical protein